MKYILYLTFLLLFSCTSGQLKQGRSIQSSNMMYQNAPVQFDSKPEENISQHLQDTSLPSMLRNRIDSFKNAGLAQGAHPAEDAEIAIYLKLKDSIRKIGPYILKYDGQQFSSRTYNAAKPKQLDAEIIESRKGIVSVSKRMKDKADYVPLLDQHIEFYNDKDQLIKTYEINSNNPFLKNREKKIKEFVFPPPDQKSKYADKSLKDWRNFAHHYNAYNRFNIQSNGFVIVEYQLNAMDQENKILKSISSLVILDSTGNKVQSFSNIENTIRHCWLTSDARYLFINGGGILGEGFQRLEHSHFRILNCQSGQIIYEESIDDPASDFSEFYESEPPLKISFSTERFKKSDDNLFTEYIFDPASRKICMRIITQSDWNKITNERIKYSGNVWLHEFEFECKTF